MKNRDTINRCPICNEKLDDNNWCPEHGYIITTNKNGGVEHRDRFMKSHKSFPFKDSKGNGFRTQKEADDSDGFRKRLEERVQRYNEALEKERKEFPDRFDENGNRKVQYCGCCGAPVNEEGDYEVDDYWD